MDIEELSNALTRVAQRIIPGALGVEKLQRLTGGASYETWAFDVTGNVCGVSLILRRMPTSSVTMPYSAGPEMEARLMDLAREKGVPVPAIRHVLVAGDNLGRGFISDRVAGETLGRKIVCDRSFADIRPGLARNCGEILARIHSIAPPGLPLVLASEQLKSLYQIYNEVGNRSAVFELAFRWLRQRLPVQQVKPCLVHGDFRNGNLVVGVEGVSAVLDWELSHLGDPAEDLGWITVNSWRFGEIDKPVGGFGSIEDLLKGYQSAGGTPVNPERVRFWRAMGSLRWGVMCGEFARERRDGEPVSVERRMIGRRVSEAEIDLLDLILGSESQ